MANKSVSVTLSPAMIDLIDQCLETGLFGVNRADVLRYLIRRGIEESGAIKMLRDRTH